MASRIEAANKQLGTEFLISEETYHLIKKKIRVNKSVSVKLHGKRGRHTLYEVIGLG